ncbi:acetyl-CoA carboxylase carboxyltransferase subunit alpha [Terrisporobacter mayombei]|uniref:Acetyl-coenzyme A carboxylase carboxyl transferase subunit alpha n=1 Tax=Terrisporobacter mayombei TaxID=1541 RepID=A0ABY9Q644_9FIRM|nr:acetyl-CoA carboxylase carboxyltransferase subunit alpha [Terrisporobacter mayombei]MCC3868842.1 acetyl-CoA carboxylase carboxyltransferase subunit alpha [Terrisporobacter mayombei]WMT83026.1 Acetyl-coenzyme A carboxylase carboxyl transferase subunit alpha [Terrisporobacter mayombei]
MQNNENIIWDKVNLARHKDRPNAKFYIENIFDEFIELHGDRSFRDDKAIIGGIGSINNINVTVIGINKGKNTKENIDMNFGMVHPEGYKKSLRLMKQAEKFKRPIICFIDTPGAFCGIGAEERGQGYAIAQNLLEMSSLKTPVISIIIGEGGSGGALALALGDKVYMMENSIYSILSPEGFASILWKDVSKAKKAALAMKITSHDLKDFGIIDDIIMEPENGAHTNPLQAAENIKEYILKDLNNLIHINSDELLKNRYDKFRKMGSFECDETIEK